MIGFEINYDNISVSSSLSDLCDMVLYFPTIAYDLLCQESFICSKLTCCRRNISAYALQYWGFSNQNINV